MLNPNVHYVKFMRGSTAAWEKLKQTPERISDDTLYFVYDPANKSDKIGKAYLGQKLLSGVGEIPDYIAFEDLGNVYIDQETLADKDILVYDSELGDWKNATLDEVIADWAAEVEAAPSGSTVPAVSLSGTYTPEGDVTVQSITLDSGHNFAGSSIVLSTIVVPKGTITISPTTTASGHSLSINTVTINEDDPALPGHDMFVTFTEGDPLTIPVGVEIGSANTNSGHTLQMDEVTLTHTPTTETVQSEGSYTPQGTIKVGLTVSKASVVPVTTPGTAQLLGTVTDSVLVFYEMPNTQYVTNVSVLTATTSTYFTGTAKSVTVTSKKAVVTNIGPDHVFSPTGSVKGNHTLDTTIVEDYITNEFAEREIQITGSVKGAHLFTGQNTDVSINYTPEGEIKGTHKFTGIAKSVTVSKALIAKVAASITASGKYKPEGTISSIEMPSTTHTHQLTLN